MVTKERFDEIRKIAREVKKTNKEGFYALLELLDELKELGAVERHIPYFDASEKEEE